MVPLYIFTGRGGAGKSTFAASICILFAKKGKDVIAVELFPLLGKPALSRIISEQPTHIRKRIVSLGLYPEKVAREYVLRKVRVEFLTSILVRTELFKYILSTAPGLKELLCLGKIWQLCKDASTMGYNAVVWDAPPFERLMELINVPIIAAESTKGSPVYREALKIIKLLRDTSRFKLFYIIDHENDIPGSKNSIPNTYIQSNHLSLNPSIIILNKCNKMDEGKDQQTLSAHPEIPFHRVPFFYKTNSEIPLKIQQELEICLKKIQ